MSKVCHAPYCTSRLLLSFGFCKECDGKWCLGCFTSPLYGTSLLCAECEKKTDSCSDTESDIDTGDDGSNTDTDTE